MCHQTELIFTISLCMHNTKFATVKYDTETRMRRALHQFVFHIRLTFLTLEYKSY